MTDYVTRNGRGLAPRDVEHTETASIRSVGRAGEPVPARAGLWERHYRRSVVALDLIVAVVVLGAAVAAGFGGELRDAWLGPRFGLVSLLCLIGWMLALRAWEFRILGQGVAEFSRLLNATVGAAVSLGMYGLAAEHTAARPYTFGFIPLAGVAMALGRIVLRKRLHRRRRRGVNLHDVLVVGGAEVVTDLVTRTRRASYFGWRVTGACTPDGRGTDGSPEIEGVQVVGDLDSATPEALSGRYRVVAVGAADGWSLTRLRDLAWSLEGRGVDLVVHPGLMEVSGPRLHVSAVDGLPLLRLDEPKFTGGARLLKGAIDKIAAAVLILLMAPLLTLIYLAVRLDGGPAIYRQRRVGLGNSMFEMLKFRSMVVDADRLRAKLNGHDLPLFKLKDDPRVTRVGHLLRRYSLDELPQLFNVLSGSMSLVGPRPPLPEEVALYEPDVSRRLLVKPGLTGLWQVSGRSDLSWEESVRLDLRYVENWTLVLDTVILWKTVRAVVSGRGAY